MKKVELLAIVVIIVAALILGWIGLSPLLLKKAKVKPTEPSPVSETTLKPEEDFMPVRVQKVVKRNFEDAISVLGTVKGYLEIDLKFETNGIIKILDLKEGNLVKKGDIIAELDDREAQLKLQYSKKKWDSAWAQSLGAYKKKEILEGLYKAGAIIKQKLEEATLEAESYKSQVGMAEAEIELAQAEINKTYLKSPKDGIIGPKEAEIGEFVTPQNKILTFFDLSKVYVEIGIVERDIEKIKLGQRVEVVFDSYPRDIYDGKIDTIFPVVEGKSRTLTVRVLLDNAKSLLLPGMFSRAKVYLTEIKNAIVLPSSSVLAISPEVNVVPAIDLAENKLEDVEKGIKPGKIALRRVTAGYSSADYVEIISGIKEGDLVVIESKGELKEGVKAKVVGVEEALM